MIDSIDKNYTKRVLTYFILVKLIHGIDRLWKHRPSENGKASFSAGSNHYKYRFNDA